MLRYRINIDEARREAVEIPISSFEIADNANNPELLTVTCHYDDDLDLWQEMNFYITQEFDYQTQTNPDVQTATLEVSTQLSVLNPNFRYFSFDIFKYYDLRIKEIEIIEINNSAYLKFIFEDFHYFSTWDEPIKFYARFNGEVWDDEQQQTVTKYIEKVFENCEYEDEYSLLWRYDKESLDIDAFMCAVFHNDTYKFVGYEGNEESVEMEEVPVSACFTDELYIKVPVVVGCDNRYEYYEKDCNEGDISGLISFRDQMLENFTIYTEHGHYNLPLSLSQMHDVNLLQEDNIMSKFVYDETRRSINNIVEMEKFAYHPVFVKPNTDNDFQTEDIYKIKFNLHFRQHRGDDWSVDNNSYWNGVNNINGQLETEFSIDDNAASQGTPFFVYSQKSKQSDLLSYLGFTNSDVKYQKNKLKKSFLRLLFYDSDNPTTQNLLAQSTIFMDVGKLFTRYMNNIMTEGYRETEKANASFQTGAKVNTEFSPTKSQKFPKAYNEYTDEEIEEHRLSSQLVVTDTYNSSASSEGFYIYLWMDNDQRNVPSDLYMKVEFNHAGYGRTIPFMMPYFDFKTEEKLGIKTFEEIMSDWQKTNGGYGIRRYNRYSYIHLKYRYDKEKERRVYYLDPEVYGDDAYYNRGSNIDKSPNELEINLYEAKVTFTDN